MTDQPIHATAVARGGFAVLLRGPSGAGKSDLALRLIDRGWRLVSDDQTELYLESGRLIARAPEAIANRMEVRAVGIRQVTAAGPAEVALLVDLRPHDELDRLPEPRSETLAGVPVPSFSLDPFARSSEIKLELLLQDEIARRAAAGPTRPEEQDTMAAKEPIDREDTEPEGPQAHRLVVVTGMSGAGRWTTLKALEDLGYEVIDNLPLDLLERILPAGESPRPLAVGVDIRTRRFAAGPVLQQLDTLAARPGLGSVLLFLDCEDDVLVSRFSETRRPHPLAEDRPIADGIAAERRLLAPLQARADFVINTTGLSPANLRHVLRGHLDVGRARGMALFVLSFSYRGGLPRQADLVFDARFLANPHYEAALRDLSGQDQPVVDYVRQDPAFAPYFEELTAWLAPQLPRFESQNKSYLTLAVGCTGGRHRSVMVAEALAEWLRGQGRPVILTHRDLDRGD